MDRARTPYEEGADVSHVQEERKGSCEMCIGPFAIHDTDSHFTLHQRPAYALQDS